VYLEVGDEEGHWGEGHPDVSLEDEAVVLLWHGSRKGEADVACPQLQPMKPY
jgi:hypothetical protein